MHSQNQSIATLISNCPTVPLRVGQSCFQKNCLVSRANLARDAVCPALGTDMIHMGTLDQTRKILKGVACIYVSAHTCSYSGGGANVNHVVWGGGDPVSTQAFVCDYIVSRRFFILFIYNLFIYNTSDAVISQHRGIHE